MPKITKPRPLVVRFEITTEIHCADPECLETATASLPFVMNGALALVLDRRRLERSTPEAWPDGWRIGRWVGGVFNTPRGAPPAYAICACPKHAGKTFKLDVLEPEPSGDEQ